MLDHIDIRAILPQGHPVVLLDRVIAMVPGQSLIGEKAVSGCEPCYADPQAAQERYAYPPSLVLESFGQAAAILWLESARPNGLDADELLMFTVARGCEMLGAAYPGDVLRHHVRLDNIVGDNVFVTGDVSVGDRRIMTIGSMVATLRPQRTVVGNHNTIKG